MPHHQPGQDPRHNENGIPILLSDSLTAVCRVGDIGSSDCRRRRRHRNTPLPLIRPPPSLAFLLPCFVISLCRSPIPVQSTLAPVSPFLFLRGPLLLTWTKETKLTCDPTAHDWARLLGHPTPSPKAAISVRLADIVHTLLHPG
jgi:hypothetical protein